MAENEVEDVIVEDKVETEVMPEVKVPFEPKSGVNAAFKYYLKPSEDKVESVSEEKIIEKKEVVEPVISSKEEETPKPQTQAEVNEYKNDFESLSEDFFNNYDKVREKYKLPALATLKEMVSEGDPNQKLKTWQETNLRKEIEEKHGLLEGEFEYDASEASQVGTPSYDWDDLTNNKKAEVFGSYKARQEQDRKNLEKVRIQQEKDFDFLAEKHFGTREVVQTKIQEMNDTVRKISQGEVDPSNHPFGVKNLVRGMFHEELTEKAVNEAIKNLTEEYAKHQMYLPGKDMPTDATRFKTPIPRSDGELFTEAQRRKSPMFNSMNISTRR